jgi:hypothetical protein
MPEAVEVTGVDQELLMIGHADLVSNAAISLQ